MRGERLEIVMKLHRRRASETVDEHQRRATATAEVVQIDPVDRHGLAFERGERLGHELSVSASALRGAGRDWSSKPEIREHATRHEVKRDVAAADVEQSERVGDAEPDKAEQQKDHASHPAERLRVGHTAGSREAADADHHMNQVVHEVDLADSNQLVVEKAQDPSHEINGAEDG